MFYTILYYIFYVLVSLGGLYIVTTTILLLIARIEKDKDGDLILDPDSWHFKLTFPFVKFHLYLVERLSGDINICKYCIKFSLMLYLGWPMLIILICLKTVVYSPLMFLFGLYPIANLESMSWAKSDFIEFFHVDVGRIRMPKIKENSIVPFYVVVPIAYITCLNFYTNVTLIVSLVGLGLAVLIALAVSIVFTYRWLVKTDEETVSLVREWMGSRKRKFCRTMKVKPIVH